MNILGYKYIIDKGNHGYFPYIMDGNEELVVNLIKSKFSFTYWRNFLTPFKFFKFYEIPCLFPEFIYREDIKRLEILLNSNLLISICNC